MLAQSVTSNGKHTRPASWSLSWRRNAWMRRLCGLTSPPSTLAHGAESWIASLRVSRASPTAPQESAKDSLTNAGYGTTSRESFGILERGSWLSKTYQDSLLPEDLPLASRDWPKWGSMQSGVVSRRPAWAPATSASESSYWPSSRAEDAESCGNHPGAVDSLTGAVKQWQTPATDSFRSRGGDRKDEMGLDQQSRHWATPNAHNAQGEPGIGHSANQGRRRDLVRESMSWQTPAARDHKGANSAEHATLTGGGRKHMNQLSNFVEFSHQAQAIRDGGESLVRVISTGGSALSPTSRASSVLGRRRLNPAFVCWLMGSPLWLTNSGVNNYMQSAMASYRSQLRQRLIALRGGLD